MTPFSGQCIEQVARIPFIKPAAIIVVDFHGDASGATWLLASHGVRGKESQP
ncbi:MAG: hypothetical protein ABW082_10315 [Sedimenticola sp.]